MNNLNESKNEMINLDVVDLTEPGLEKLYLGHKFIQYLCFEITTTPDITWNNLIKDYRLSLTHSKHGEQLVSPFDETGETYTNLQLQLRELSSYYLDDLSPEINNLFYNIKSVNEIFVTYFKYLKKTVENFRDSNYRNILNLLQKKIRSKKEKTETLYKNVDKFLNKIEKNYLDLYRKEEICRDYLTAFENDVEAILIKIEMVKEEIKQSNLKQIEESFKNNSALTFSMQKSDRKDKDNKEISNEEELERLEAKLRKYNQEYLILVGLVYLAKQFTNAAHTIKLGINMVARSWEALEEYFSDIDLQLQKNGEDTFETILKSLDVIKAGAEEVKSKIEKLEDALSMKVLGPHNNEQSANIQDSSFLKLVCQK